MKGLPPRSPSARRHVPSPASAPDVDCHRADRDGHLWAHRRRPGPSRELRRLLRDPVTGATRADPGGGRRGAPRAAGARPGGSTTAGRTGLPWRCRASRSHGPPDSGGRSEIWSSGGRWPPTGPTKTSSPGGLTGRTRRRVEAARRSSGRQACGSVEGGVDDRDPGAGKNHPGSENADDERSEDDVPEGLDPAGTTIVRDQPPDAEDGHGDGNRRRRGERVAPSPS